jgi:hypothetical protein
MIELELYKLIMTPDHSDTSFSYVSEMGWSGDMFLVWVDYWSFKEFMERLANIFGNGLFDDGGFSANMQSDGVCIDLVEALGSYIDIEDVFPKDKFKH